MTAGVLRTGVGGAPAEPLTIEVVLMLRQSPPPLVPDGARAGDPVQQTMGAIIAMRTTHSPACGTCGRECFPSDDYLTAVARRATVKILCDECFTASLWEAL